MGILLRSCVKVREAIELSFWVVIGVALGICVLDGVRISQREGQVLGSSPYRFEWRF